MVSFKSFTSPHRNFREHLLNKVGREVLIISFDQSSCKWLQWFIRLKTFPFLVIIIGSIVKKSTYL